MSIFIALFEGTINSRSLAYCFVALNCVGAFLFLKSLDPKKNFFFMSLTLFSLGIALIDFCVQFGVLGPDGWRKSSMYSYCFNLHGRDNHQEMYVAVCRGFKVIYYSNLFIYLSLLCCFGAFIFTSVKLLLMTKYIGSGQGFLVKLEEQIDEEENTE